MKSPNASKKGEEPQQPSTPKTPKVDPAEVAEVEPPINVRAALAALVKECQEAIVQTPGDVSALCLEPLDLAIVYHVKICSASGVVGTVRGTQTLHEQLSDGTLSVTLRQVNSVIETNIAGPIRIKTQRLVEDLARPPAEQPSSVQVPTMTLNSFSSPPVLPPEPQLVTQPDSEIDDVDAEIMGQ